MLSSIEKIKMTLIKSAMETLKRFYSKGIYNKTTGFNIQDWNGKNRVHLHKEGRFKFSDLEGIIQTTTPKKIVFEDLELGDAKVKAIVSARTLYNRMVQELCMKLPFPELKNKLYRHLGMGVGRGVIIAPNVVFDYLYPELIAVGEGSVIGEEAIVAAHFLYPRRYEIGPVSIGKECAIGGRAIIHPGVTIGDYAIVGTNVVVYKDVPEGAVVKSG